MLEVNDGGVAGDSPGCAGVLERGCDETRASHTCPYTRGGEVTPCCEVREPLSLDQCDRQVYITAQRRYSHEPSVFHCWRITT